MNEKEPLISVIVPVYGVEQYLDKCVESIIHQTYDNLEIILVDDGSKDRSGQMCDTWSKKDSRIVVYHKQNGGLSDARNYGIDRAKGEYLTFIDSDDYVDKDYIEFLYNLLAVNNCKLSLCSLHVYFSSNNRVWDKGNGSSILINGKKAIEMLCYHDEVDTAAYGKLIHKDLFYNVRFPVGKIFEDIGTMYLILDQCEKIACHFLPKYTYVIRANSIVTSGFNLAKLDMIEMTDKMADYVEKKYPDLKKAALRRRGYARFSTLNHMLDVKEKDLIAVRKNIEKDLLNISGDVIRDEKTPKRDKIAYRLLRINFKIYRFFWKLYLKVQRG